MAETNFDRCARCGALRRDHRLVQEDAASGPPRAADERLAVCPTAIFRDPRAADAQDDEELGTLMADDVSSPPRRVTP